MASVFSDVLNVSIVGAIASVVVIIARLLFKSIPRWITCVLWAIVALRLICPALPESDFSLIPSFYFEEDSSTVEIISYENPSTYSASHANNSETIPQGLVESENSNDNSSYLTTVLSVGSYVWCIGAVFMIGYGVCSYIRTRVRFRDAVLYKDNIRQSEKVSSPFVMGLLNPQIYIPFCMDTKTRKQVILHEQSHIERFDHIWKPFGFVLLCLHWFNPLMWTSYILFCRDIEVACDERVIKNYGIKMKKAYAMALLKCKSSSTAFSAYPLAFGEIGVGVRIKKTLKYRKNTVIIAVAGFLTTLLLSVCLLTNPVSAESDVVEDNRALYIESKPVITNIAEDVTTVPVTEAPTEPVTVPATEPIVEQGYVNDTEVSYNEEYYYEEQSYDYNNEYSFGVSEVKKLELKIEPMTLSFSETYDSTGSHASSLLSFNNSVYDNKFDPNEHIYIFGSEQIRDSMNDMNRVIGSKRYR